MSEQFSFGKGAVLCDHKGNPVCVITAAQFSQGGRKVSIEAVTYGEIPVPIGSAANLIATAPSRPTPLHISRDDAEQLWGPEASPD